MNDHAPNTWEKLDAMLSTARRHSADACRAIDDEAQAEARAIIARAHKDARAKVHAAIQHERRTGKLGLEKVRARIDTDKRQKMQDKEHAFLSDAWARLDEALNECWRDAALRQAWIEATLARCAETLLPGTWTIEHPADWNTAELEPHLHTIQNSCDCAPDLKAQDDLPAGLRVEVGGAVLDASVDGILADRDHISALLLAELFEHLGGPDAEDAL